MHIISKIKNEKDPSPFDVTTTDKGHDIINKLISERERETYWRIVNVHALACTVKITGNNYWFGSFKFLQTKTHISVLHCKLIL